MLLLGKLLDDWGYVFLLYPSLATIAIDIGQLVDAQRVRLVKRDKIQLSNRGGGFGWRGVLDESKSASKSEHVPSPPGRTVSGEPEGQDEPERHPILAHRHENQIFLVLPTEFSFFSRNLTSFGF